MISSSFGGTANYTASNGSGIVTINPSPTTVTIKSAAGARGTTVVLQAILKRTSDNGLLNGRTLHFYVDGNFVGNGTMVAGVAKRNFTIPASMAVGLHNVRADYDGEAFYLTSTKNGSYLTVK